MIKLDGVQAVKNLQERWPNFDFSGFVYEGGKIPSRLMCSTHGEVSGHYSRLISTKTKTPCVECAKKAGHLAAKFTPKSNVKLSQEEAIKNMAEKFSDYDFSKFRYTTSKDKSLIICREHGEILNTYATVMKGQTPCRKCSNKIISSVLTKDNDEAIYDLKARFPDYDFLKFVYEGSTIPSTVICKVHGELNKSRTNILLKNYVCGLCNSRFVKDTKDFVEALKVKFPNTWDLCDYSKTKYVGTTTKLLMTCKEHGDFEKTSNECLNSEANYVCTKCNYKVRAEGKTHTRDSFLEKYKDRLSPLDSFKNLSYVNSDTKIEVTCKEHGSYFLLTGNYIKGQRCPKCSNSSTSKGELELFSFIQGLVSTCQSKVKPISGITLELDVYIPELKLGFEYNGIFFHRDSTETGDLLAGKMASKTSLLKKTQLYSNAGIRVVHIFEDEWLEKQDIVKARIKSILNVGDRFAARKCEVLEVSAAYCQLFEDKNHIQGPAYSASIRYGLYEEGVLRAVMTLGKLRKIKVRPTFL